MNSHVISLGTSGTARNATAAIAEDDRLVAVCPQERVTRLRGAGVNDTGLPDEAVELLLSRRGLARADVSRVVRVSPAPGDSEAEAGVVSRARAQACAAFFTSGLPRAAVMVCHADEPAVSVWRGDGGTVEHAWTWPGAGFTDVLVRLAGLFGSATGAERRLEALARLKPGARDGLADRLIALSDGVLRVDEPAFNAVSERLAAERNPAGPDHVHLAASMQSRFADLVEEALALVRHRTGLPAVCLAGRPFFSSAINSRVREGGTFEDVFIPVDPGPHGLAVGALLDMVGQPPVRVSPFLGPAYSPEETKSVLDNCKLQYSWETEEGAARAAIESLRAGRLVGWFDGAMEWGPRSLGARCILADATTPYVLENLNHFLKGREPWRGYALSCLAERVHDHFQGPAQAPFMECDYRPAEPSRLKHVLPSPSSAVRVQTVAAGAAPAKFRALLEAYEHATGVPFLVNTSFNGFHEPIVCSPRDAVRVFFGSGLDMLVINQFVLRK